MPEDRNDDHDCDKVDTQKTMRNLEIHPEQGCRTLAVSVQIVQNGQDDQDGKKSIQHNEKKIIDLSSFESRFIESLKVKDHKL
jgi:hypothetical protein